MSDFGSGSAAGAGDSELQDFLMAEKQKAQVNAQVSHSRMDSSIADCVSIIARCIFFVDS